MNLQEIAKQCGVSVTTVSLVLNNKKGVGEDTRAQITRLLLENGYQIKKKADKKLPIIFMLKFKKYPHTIYDRSIFVDTTTDRLDSELRKRGYQLALASFNPDEMDNIAQMLKNNSPSGIIMGATHCESADLDWIENLRIPFIVLDNECQNRVINVLCIDNEQIASAAVEYLYQLGHRKIGYLATSLPSNNADARKKGFLTSMQNLLVPIHPEWEFLLEPSLPHSYESMKNILAGNPSLPTAFVANNDVLALGTMRALQELGYQIPGDISIISLGNSAYDVISLPRLTTVDMEEHDFVLWLIRVLIDSIKGKSYAPCKIKIPGAVTERGSTAPPPAI